ncbi:MAG: hypothetical protein IJY18_03820 [Clostridia bacterium]|nr:hypothetical protein [Clostridia bacterium]
MTNTKIKRIITKGAMLIAVIFMLAGGIVSHALAAVSMETENSYTPNFAFDYKDVLTAPVRIDTGDGAYYKPTSYVYYGRRYDSANQKYVSLINRVLDPNADNAGGSGAMFLLAEGATSSSRFSPYNDDTVADYLADENSYIGSALLQKIYSGAYTVYEISYVNTSTADSLPQELDHIRPITKADVGADMNGHFGFLKGNGEYFWSVVDGDGNEVDSINLLDGAKVFPLSADELYKYVGDSVFSSASAASVFIAADVFEGSPVSWWLRTALGDTAKTGEMVGIVDSNGKVTFSSAQNIHATRNAFNIETSDIAFLERVADNAYRLAFNAPEYKEGAQLEAALTDVKGNTVTFTVKNHIGNNGWYQAGESRISYVVTDSLGNEKYYGTAGKVTASSSLGEKVAESETFTLTLPEFYENGDKVLVFSERSDDPERISTSYVSNFVDLGCIHTPAEGDEANCLNAAFCSVCHLTYGEPDKSNHKDVSSVWEYNEGEGTHSRECLSCGVKVYTEPCSFTSLDLSAPVACYASSCNDCGHKVDDPSLHNYGENGVCIETYGEYHYRMPEIENSSNTGFEVKISTVGEWNALAEWLNGGGYLCHLNEKKYVSLTADLDFEGVPFVPMGTSELPVMNLDIQGNRKTVSGIEYNAVGSEPAGIIAVGKNVEVNNITLSDSSFSGSDAGSIVGRLCDETDDCSSFSGIAVTDVMLEGDNAGGVVGTLTAKASLSYSFIYNVTNNGIDVDFSSNGKLIPTPASESEGIFYSGCYRLAPESDGKFAFTAEAFASGMITYRLRRIDPYWKQNLGSGGHAYPVYRKDGSAKTVYRVVSCDGVRVTYSNEDLGQIKHGSYTSVDHSTFEWVDGIGVFGVGFKVKAVCGLCEETTEVVLEADWTPFYAFSGKMIARLEFNAYIDINGSRTKVNDEPKVIFSNKLEELIGMTPLTVKYNGNRHYADVLFDNLRDGLTYSRDFDAYFLDPLTGERISEIQYDYYGRPEEIPAGVKNVGIYDVLIVGNGGFEGYEYLYEDVFTVERARVTVDPKDVQKIYDGNKKFEVEYELGGDAVWDVDLDISIDDSPSERVGKYTVNVKADLTSHSHGDNIELTLLRDKVTALILPDLTLSISNKSYPESVTYGDPIPEVKAEHFNISAGADISYQWFIAGSDFYGGYFAERAIDSPKDAGVYILRVHAMSKDGSLISNSLDLEFRVTKRMLTVDLYAPENTKTEKRDSNTYYILDAGKAFSYNVKGFINTDTLESLGLKLEIYLQAAEGGSLEGSSNTDPAIPLAGGYRVQYRMPVNSNYEVGGYVVHSGGNEEIAENGTVYILIRNPGYVYPTETDFVSDGEPISPNIIISVPPAAGLTPNGSSFNYTVKVFDPDGFKVLEKNGNATALDEIYLYNHTFVEKWDPNYNAVRGVFAAEGDYRVTVEVNGAGMDSSYETSFTLLFFNSFGEGISEIVEPGIYTVKVINESGAEYESVLYAKQKLTMNLKPHEYNLSEGRVEYDPTKVIMEAGNVIHLNHELVEVYFSISESQGKIYVSGVKVLDKEGNDVSRLYYVEHETSSWPSHNDEMNICHIFDNPCDYDCNLSGCDYVRATAHSGGTATCREKAVCDICGSLYGDYAHNRHESKDFIVYPNVSSPDESHLLVYVCCGGTKETVAHTHITPATCTERAVCSECGWEYGELDPTNHSSDERTYTNDGGTHKVTYHCCGAVVSEDHSGGTAYCNAKPICSLCGGSYGEINPENHAEEHQYIPDESDPTRHNELYACCGKSTSYTHSGGDATCIAKAVCEYCKAEYGELEPADHASESFAYRQDMDNPSLHTVHHACCDVFIEKDYHSGGEANCQSPALCASCGTPYGDRDHSKHASGEYLFYPDPENADQHVAVTACCGEFARKEQHTFGEATCLHAATCACGAESGEPLEHTYDNDCDAICNVCNEQTRAAAFHVGKDGEPCENCGELIPKEPISGGAVSAIVTASTVAASAGGISLFWFVIKKKSLSELLGLLFK